ncbi:Ig-like domain-containing protein [Rhodobacteraceae bacterium D3-12]|nr:Ig-like domain-containing protein [Rhodobacteraceae bacterium D3-12]
MADLILDWGLFGAYGTDFGASQTVDTGGVEVTVDFNVEDEGAQAFTFNADGYVGAGEDFDPNSFLKLFGEGGEGGVDDTSTTTINFAASDDQYGDAVQNVTFRINDIDAGPDDTGEVSGDHIDMLSVRGYDADGNEVPVSLTLGSATTADGPNGVEGDSTGLSPTDGAGSVLVSIDGPVSRIEIDYENGGEGDQRVLVSDIHFSTTEAMPEDPDAMDDTAETDTLSPVVVDVLANDTDPQDQTLTITETTDGTNGSVTIDPTTGNPLYTPDAGFTGTDTFTYTVADPDGNTDTATVTVTVDEPNSVDAVDDTASTDAGDPVEVAVLANDTDPEGDGFTVTDTTDGTNGTVAIDPTSGNPVYTPEAGFTGTDTFTYTITDDNGATDTATVTVTVDEPNSVDAVDDTASTDAGDPVEVAVLANDTDPEGDGFTVTDTTDGTNGTVAIDPTSGNPVYTPEAGFTGTDTFTYTITDDNGATDTATVTVTVDEPNSVDAVDDTASTDAGDPVEVAVLANDTDPEGDGFTVTDTTEGTNGTVAIDPTSGNPVYTPEAGFTGTDTFTYTITDDNGATDTATVTVTVDEPNSVDAVDDTASTDAGDPVEVAVLANDTDPEGDGFTVTDTTDGTNGTVAIDPTSGNPVYTPEAGFTGTDTFTYTITDDNGATDTATVTVTVGEPNSVDAVDDTASTDAGDPVEVAVLANDTDPEGDGFTVTDTTDGTNGTVAIDPTSGNPVYTPEAGFTGTDTFTYTITDDNGATDTATVTVTVGEPNSVDAVDDTASTDAGDPVEVAVLANDTDPEGDGFTVTDTTDGTNGTVAIDPTSGNPVYTPEAGFTGTDTFTYTITDDNGATDTATVTVTVGDATPPNYIVEGDEGDDYIDVNYTGDPDGDMIDNMDNMPGNPPQQDTVQANGGDDTVLAGEGDDDVNGGEGDDVLYGEEGDDIVIGEEGDDVLYGNEGSDTLFGGDGNDTAFGGDDDDVIDTSGNTPAIDVPTLPGVPVDATPGDDLDYVDGGDGNDDISTGDDSDTIEGGAGDDTINPGIDDDVVLGGDGDDLITDPQGSDDVEGGAGDDTILVGVDTFSDYVGDDPNLPIGSITSDPNPTDGMDTVDGGAGNDSIMTGDDADVIFGGTGMDTIHAGIDDDYVEGNEDDDSIIGGHGSDTIFGGAGDDWINAGDSNLLWGQEPDETDPVPTNGLDFVDGGEGNDTIFGEDDDDTLVGGAGDDLIDGGIDDDALQGGTGDDTLLGGDGDDVIEGEEGNDSIDGGAGDDTLLGGDGMDTFSNVNAGDIIDGGDGPVDDGPEDYDTLNLAGSAPTGGRFEITYTSADQQDGIVNYFDADDNDAGSLVFTEIENVVPCFTPGTAIATPKGERMVEELNEGDKIITRDNGIQEIRWIGRRALTGHELARMPNLRPILIQKGALGDNLPEHDILVSPQHRMLMTGDKAQLYFEEREVLAAAKHLTDLPGVDEVGTLGVSYVHFMFDQHEVVLSNGAWTESFQPGANVLSGLENAQRDEILTLFPDLKTAEGVEDYSAARRALKKHEARLLVR